MLVSEFETKISDARIYEVLQERKIKREEPTLKCYTVMKEIASLDAVDHAFLFKCITNGYMILQAIKLFYKWRRLSKNSKIVSGRTRG